MKTRTTFLVAALAVLGLALAIGPPLPTADAATTWTMKADANVSDGAPMSVEDETSTPGSLASNTEGKYYVYYVDSDLADTTQNAPLLDFDLGTHNITSTVQSNDEVIKIVARSFTHGSGGGDILFQVPPHNRKADSLSIETTALLKINSAIIWYDHYTKGSRQNNLISFWGSGTRRPCRMQPPFKGLNLGTLPWLR